MSRGVSRRFVLVLCFLVFLPVLGAAQQVSLTILHTNDTHGHLLPFSYPPAPPGSDIAALRVRTNIGGIARRATLVKRLRAELEPKGTTVWLVDAGDYSEGTPFSTVYHGEADIAAMNATGYTFGTLGNHELDNSLSMLKKLLGEFKFPVLCANVTETATGQPLVRPSEIRTVGPLKIGIFGLLTHEAATYPAAKDGLAVADEIETARRMAKALRREADIVILISHAGKYMDEQISKAVPDIDVIIGGHSHTRMTDAEVMQHSDTRESQRVSETIIVQAFQWGGELGRLDLVFAKDDKGEWRVGSYHDHLIEITPDIPEDEAVAALVMGYWKPIAARYGEIIGQAGGDFVQRGNDAAEYNLVADAVRETYGTEVELENTGGVRAPLAKGNITMADLVDIDPFKNTVVTFKISGRQLRGILLKNRPAVSGLRYRIERGQLTEVTVGGQPLDDDRIYTGASNSYMAGGALKEIKTTDTGILRRDVLIEYIRKKGTVQPSYDGRRVIINNEVNRKNPPGFLEDQLSAKALSSGISLGRSGDIPSVRGEDCQVGSGLARWADAVTSAAVCRQGIFSQRLIAMALGSCSLVQQESRRTAALAGRFRKLFGYDSRSASSGQADHHSHLQLRLRFAPYVLAGLALPRGASLQLSGLPRSRSGALLLL